MNFLCGYTQKFSLLSFLYFRERGVLKYEIRLLNHVEHDIPRIVKE